MIQIDIAPTRRPSAVGIWVGLSLVAAGLALIVLAWGIVASEPLLRDQIAPLVLAGLGGLAVVVIGLAVAHAAAARRDEDEFARQLDSLTSLLQALGEGKAK